MIDKILEDKIAEVIDSLDATLYDIEIAKEFERSIFRIYITSEDGIDLDKCERVSKMISPLLDVEEPIYKNYFFEVSSPGVERILSKPKHFSKSIGENLNIKLNDGQKIRGKLEEYRDGTIKVASEDGEKEIKLEDIKKAKTLFDWGSTKSKK